MSSIARDDGDRRRATEDALALLRAIPAIAHDPKALAALEALDGERAPTPGEKARELGRAAALVGSSLDLDRVLAKALDVAVSVMHAERGFIVLEGRRPVGAFHNMKRSQSEGPSQSIVAAVIETGSAVFTTDAQADPHWNAHQSIASSHLRSIACVPLQVRGKTIGAVYLDSRVIPGLFTPGDRELLTAFANEASLSIENARLFEAERERSSRFAALEAFGTRILDAIANGVITLSPERTITTFNHAAEVTFDMPAKRMVGKSQNAIARLIPDFPELFDEFVGSGAVQLRAEVEAMKTDGSPLTLELRFAPMDTAGGLSVAMVVTDVTRQRYLEDTIEASKHKSLRIADSFSRYLAPHVVKTLMNDPGSIRLGGERKRATTLFADVRGFTAMAAQMDVERIVEILNTYFEEAVRIVFEFEGLLDKFYGDGLMAVFGPPLLRDDDAARAVAAAIRLHEVVARLGPRLDYPLQISVGLATGDVVAGHFGSSKRMDYTVIGDAVNRANGLQAAAPPGAIYCDEETIAAAGTIARPLHKLAVRVKGREDPVAAFAIFPRLARTPVSS